MNYEITDNEITLTETTNGQVFLGDEDGIYYFPRKVRVNQKYQLMTHAERFVFTCTKATKNIVKGTIVKRTANIINPSYG